MDFGASISCRFRFKTKALPPHLAKAKYLIRDTMKVIGVSEEIPKPIFALFYVDLDDPISGGTGHTIRVCQMENVPFAFQDSWGSWGR